MDKTNTLDLITTQQSLDIASIDRQLKGISDSRKKMMHLQLNYPSIYIYILRKLFDREDEIQTFMEKCKKLKYSHHKDYSLYLHGYLIPYLNS